MAEYQWFILGFMIGSAVVAIWADIRNAFD